MAEKDPVFIIDPRPPAGEVNAGVVLQEDFQGHISDTTKELSVTSSTQSRADACSGGAAMWGARHTLVVLAFLGFTVAFMVRVSLSITIVAMVGRNVTSDESDGTCPAPGGALKENSTEGEFDWDETTQGTILGAFYFGYTATNFLGGRAAELLGGRLMFGLGVVVSSLLTLLSPLSVYTSKELFIALRVLEGMTQGVVYPSMNILMAAWIPPKDKAKYCSLVFSGVPIGTVLAMAVGGWLSSTNFLNGWPSVFYVFGGLGVLWGIPWFLLIHDLPEHHPRISPSELQYIQANRYYVKRDKALSIPWRDIVTSVPFWSIMATSFCDNFSFYTLLSELPTYFKNILHFDLDSNGLSSALPYVIQGVTCVLWGLFVDFLHNRNFISLKVVRKLSTSASLYGAAVCLIGMMWVKCNSTAALVVMCLAVGAGGPINSGSILSEQDIAPNLAGTLKGFTNTLGSATGFIAPAVTGAIITDNQTVRAWNTVFGLSAAFNIIFCTVFVLFSSEKVQPWNEPKPKVDKP